MGGNLPYSTVPKCFQNPRKVISPKRQKCNVVEITGRKTESERTKEEWGRRWQNKVFDLFNACFIVLVLIKLHLLADSGFLRTLDSSIKRNTAVIKKLKQINEEQRESLMDELRSVNLSKFVSEAVTAICDAKLRSSDIQAAVQVCAFAVFHPVFYVIWCFFLRSKGIHWLDIVTVWILYQS